MTLGGLAAIVALAACDNGGSGTPTTTTPACSGVKMTRGQADIDAAPEGTTFCLSGTHNWSLRPKDGNSFIGPAILDGENTTVYAFKGEGIDRVTLSNLEIRNYAVGDQQGAISAHETIDWKFLNLQVHDNRTKEGGTGAELGVNSLVRGGRYYNNGSLGIGGGGGADGWVIDGVEIDHNNFTDNTYSKRAINCGYEGGGVKWTARNTTVKNSYVHHNACKGLWADLDADNTTITNTRVENNWDEGIFIEVSSGATVTGNTVIGNGKRSYNSGSNGCRFPWGGGITLASSDRVVVSGNTLRNNCNGITGSQQDREEGDPGLLELVDIRDNSVSGAGKSGVVADNGVDLTKRSISFAGNTFTNNATLLPIPD